MEAKGTITQILEVESGTSKAGKEWKRQAFVIDTGAQYNPNICFGLFGDEKIEILSSFKVGDEVEVFANVSSRAHNDKWYHSIDCWRMINQAQSEPAAEVPAGMESNDSDDLPF